MQPPRAATSSSATDEPNTPLTGSGANNNDAVVCIVTKNQMKKIGIFLFSVSVGVYASFYFYFLFFLHSYDYAVYVLGGYSVVNILILIVRLVLNRGKRSGRPIETVLLICVKAFGIALILAFPKEKTPEMYIFIIYSIIIGGVIPFNGLF
jgi:hypothetical protein